MCVVQDETYHDKSISPPTSPPTYQQSLYHHHQPWQDFLAKEYTASPPSPTPSVVRQQSTRSDALEELCVVYHRPSCTWQSTHPPLDHQCLYNVHQGTMGV